MPTGISPRREREFKKLERQFKTEQRYPGREEEVAARIVNKQRAQYGETRAEKIKDREGTSPDRGLPIADYQKLTIPKIVAQLQGLSAADLRKIRAHEIRHKNRKGLLARLERKIGR